MTFFDPFWLFRTHVFWYHVCCGRLIKTNFSSRVAQRNFNEIFSLKVCQDSVGKCGAKVSVAAIWPPGGASAVNANKNVNKSSFWPFFGNQTQNPMQHCNTCPSKQCLTLPIFEIDPTYGYEFDFS